MSHSQPPLEATTNLNKEIKKPLISSIVQIYKEKPEAEL